MLYYIIDTWERMWHFILYHSCVRKNVTLHMLSFIPKKECDIFGYIISFMCISEKECVISDFFLYLHIYFEKERDISCSIISFIHTWERMWQFFVLYYHSYLCEKEYDIYGSILSFLSKKKNILLSCVWCSHHNGKLDLDLNLFN